LKIKNVGDSNKLMLTPEEETTRATTVALVVVREITEDPTINQIPLKNNNQTGKEEDAPKKVNKNINLKTELEVLNHLPSNSRRLLIKTLVSS
jgi:hypothetical protein